MSPNVPSIIPDTDVDGALALLMDHVITGEEFVALTGIKPQELARLVADPVRLAAVRRARIALRRSGNLDQLTAQLHSRDAVQLAAEFMRDQELHPRARLDAAEVILKAAGSDKAARSQGGAPQQVSITIDLGDGPGAGKIVVEGVTVPPARQEDEG